MPRSRLFQSVANQIIEMIENGSLQPGSHLPNERALAVQLGVSRSTIREAEIALQSAGWVSINTGAGVVVAQRGTSCSELPDVDELQALEALLLVCSEICALAAYNITDEIAEDLRQQLGSISKFAEVDLREAERHIYLTIAEASRNSALLDMFRPLLRMYANATAPGSLDTRMLARYGVLLTAGLVEVVNALSERNPAGARKTMRAHFRELIAFHLELSEMLALAEVHERNRLNRQRYLAMVKAG